VKKYISINKLKKNIPKIYAISSIVNQAEVGAQIKNFNAQAQIAQPKFLISKTQAQIAQVKNKIGKAQIAQLFSKI